MGGKDSIVIDDKTDLDAAAQATVTSAFGYQGQKCSASSRAIVHERILFIELLFITGPMFEFFSEGFPTEIFFVWTKSNYWLYPSFSFSIMGFGHFKCSNNFLEYFILGFGQFLVNLKFNIMDSIASGYI